MNGEDPAAPASPSAARPRNGRGGSSLLRAGRHVIALFVALLSGSAGAQAQTPAEGATTAQASSSGAFSADWWSHTQPVFEIHGYFRTRGELFQNFSLGRHSSSVLASGDVQYLWPAPLDQSVTQLNGSTSSVAACGSSGSSNCSDSTESGANMRFRLNPELHISDNLRIVSQVDLLDNVALGSTPNSYATQPSTTASSTTSANGYTSASNTTGYAPVNYAPISFLATTQGTPTAGINGFTNSVAVQRVWGEYTTPVGQLRFGRMPDQWGLGIVANAGDGIDSDYQTNIDRIMFTTGVKSLDLYFGGAWDFISSGPTNANAYDVYGGQPYNTCNLCNVNEWATWLVHKTQPEIQRLMLARGQLVLNGGLYATYRSQYIDLSPGETPWSTPYGATANNGFEPRQAWLVTPDLWVQALWRKLRFEAEVVTAQGQIGYLTGLSTNVAKPASVQEWGLATQTELRVMDDRLDLQFGFGWGSGDAYAHNGTSNALQPAATGVQAEYSTNGQVAPISTFRFHPDYRIDLIFWRDIMSRVEGAYYFRPSVDYDIMRHADGERFGGGAAFIWSRASEFIQTPGHKSDLGVELDLQLYYQSRDGSLNDAPDKIGGFYTMLQYGVFFPMGGLGYLPGQIPAGMDASLSAAQAARLFLGVLF
jgi:uncharacterized protein (TIGR04551 family)